MARVFFFQAEDGIRDDLVTGVQTCALPICMGRPTDQGHAPQQGARPLAQRGGKGGESGQRCHCGPLFTVALIGLIPLQCNVGRARPVPNCAIRRWICTARTWTATPLVLCYPRSPMSAPLSPAAAQAQPAMSPVLVVVLLGLLLGLQPLATDLYLPALPSIQAAFSTQVSQVQLTLTAFLLAFGCSQLAWGPLSDRFGRRPILLAGMS